jgi:hypothetical protein
MQEAAPFLQQGADVVHAHENSRPVQNSQDKEMGSNGKTGNIQ